MPTLPPDLEPFFVSAEPKLDCSAWSAGERSDESLFHPEFAGRFCYNNGMFVAYTDEGHPLVARTATLREAGIHHIPRRLQEAGFRSEDAYVPHSNDGGSWQTLRYPIHVLPRLVAYVRGLVADARGGKLRAS